MKHPLSHSSVSPLGALISLCLIQLTLWTVIPYMFNGNLPLDVVREGLSWGREWQFGYHKHPPLTSWLANLSYEALGDFGPYLLSQLFICTAYFFSFRLGKEILGPQKAAAATLLLATVFYYNWPTPEFNHNIAQIPFWAAAIYFFYQAMMKREARWWYFLGPTLALGAMTKYTIALLLPLFLIFLLQDKRYRAQLVSPHPYLAALLGLIFLSPHLIWLVENEFLPFHYYDARSGLSESPTIVKRLLNPVKFILAQVADHALLIIVLLASGLTTAHKLKAQLARNQKSDSDDNILIKDRSTNTRFLLLFLFGPLILAALWSLVSGDRLRTMWGAPMWSLSGIAALYFLTSDLTAHQLNRLVKTALPTLVTLPLIFAAVALLHPALSKKPRRTDWPAKAMSTFFESEWNKTQNCPLKIIAGDNWLTGLIAHKVPGRPSVLIDGSRKISPWITDKSLKETGMLVVWQSTSIPPALDKNLEKEIPLTPSPDRKKTFLWPRHESAEPLTIYWRILAAEGCVK